MLPTVINLSYQDFIFPELLRKKKKKNYPFHRARMLFLGFNYCKNYVATSTKKKKKRKKCKQKQKKRLIQEQETKKIVLQEDSIYVRKSLAGFDRGKLPNFVYTMLNRPRRKTIFQALCLFIIMLQFRDTKIRVRS